MRRGRVGSGFGGLGQSGCPEGSFDVQMQNWLSSLQEESATAAAVGCGPGGGTPCASPQQASQMALNIAADYCNVVSEGSIFNCPQDPACADNGVSEAQPYIAQALTFFNSLPASTWTTEAANAASGQYGGPIPSGPCPAGSFVQVGPNGVSCYGSTANEDLQNTPVTIAGSSAAAAPASAPIAVGPAPVVPSPAASSSATPSNPLAIFAPVVAPAQAQGSSDFGFLTNNVSLAGFDVPIWGLIAAGLGLFLIVRK